MQERGGAGRMTLKKVFTKPKSIYAILLLGVFTFLFLGAEYMYVNMLSLTAGEEKTVIAQNYALGVSAVGFFLYPLLYRAMKKRGQIAVLTFLAFAATVCIFFNSKAYFLFVHYARWNGFVSFPGAVGKCNSLPVFLSGSRS